MANGETIRRLAAITDEGEFERLATAVLRESHTQYRLLVHSGVNVDGKTVKAPLDGIAFVTGANPPHMIAVHHTTCGRDELERKWLHDPAGVTPRKGGKPAAPAGDLVKTIEILEQQKAATPNLRATLILTTNQEPPEGLVRKVNTAGHVGGLAIEIWSCSAIAHFLDFDPKGQWLRRSFLHIEQERLSDDLLRELSRQSLEHHHPPGDKALWVDRALDRSLAQLAGRDVVFVVAESGLGKSVACYKRLLAHVEAGGFGLILPHDVIEGASSLDDAIDAALRRLHPSLVFGSGTEARARASADAPLLLVVEDINKSGKPAVLIERMAGWSAHRKDSPQTASWQILCPIWPRVLAALGDEARKRIDALAMTAASFLAEEGASAVQRRRDLSGISITRLEAQSVSLALGHDPLLIALHDPVAPPDPDGVIGAFVEAGLGRLAESRQDFTAAEYRQSLRNVAAAMLERWSLDLTMVEAAAWFGASPQIANMLRHVARFGEILRITGPASGERLTFRHDRVRDWVLADAAADLMRRDAVPGPVLGDPYFAEVLAAALVRDDVPVAMVDRIRAVNPLALFCALRLFGESTTDIHRRVLSAAEDWLDEEATHRREHDHLRWEARRALSDSESSHVIPLISRFRERDWWSLRARFRSGDILAGIELCRQHEPGVGVVGHLELIEYVQRRRSVPLIRELDVLLRGDKPTRGSRTGALRLAGHLADPALAGAIEASWWADSARLDFLVEYLWASARCCDHDAARLLGPVCDAWGALPDKVENKHSVSPRDNLAAHNIRWAFRKGLPDSALRYFIERAKAPELQWPITHMLHGFDHPDAVEFVAREFAAKEESLEGSGRVSIFSMTIRDVWKWQHEQTGRPMSGASRSRLEQLWKSETQRKYLREQAFRLWSSTLADGDISILRTISASDDLADLALSARLRRADRQAIPGLIEKLRAGDDGYWWQSGRYIWSDELTAMLDEELTRRGGTVQRGWDVKGGIASDWLTHELLMGLAAERAEELLLKHWEQLRFSPYFVQAALYIATPRLIEAAATTVSECPDPKVLFAHLTEHYGYKTNGRPGVTRLASVQSLVPYVDHLDDLDILHLWEICNDHGWFDLRRQHIDSRLRLDRHALMYVDDGRALEHLDELLAEGSPFWADHWVDGFLEAGASTNHLMSLIDRWLSRKREASALELAAGIVVNAGNRAHVSVLTAHNTFPTNEAAPISADASFAVSRRSLN
jgi:hypothetical protein